MRLTSLLAGVGLALALALGARFLPVASDVNAPIHLHVAPRILERSAVESGRSRPVDALLWDYRSIDAWMLALAGFTLVVSVLPAARERARAAAPEGEGPWLKIAGISFWVAAAAWLLGAIPLARGGSLLDPEHSFHAVGVSFLRCVHAWSLEIVTALSLLAALAVILRACFGGRLRP